MGVFDNAKKGEVFRTKGNEELVYLRRVQFKEQDFHILMSSYEMVYDNAGNRVSRNDSMSQIQW